MYKQGLLRVFALLLPLLAVLFVRTFASDRFSLQFFKLITDSVLVVALCKVGLDVYLPSCPVVNSRIVVDFRFKFLLLGMLIVLLLMSSWSFLTGGYWQLPLLSAVVVCCLTFAEAGRLKNNFFVFYILKAPTVYVGAIVLVSFTETSYFIALSIPLVLVFLFLLIRLLKGKQTDISARSLMLSALVSLLVLTFSWKEAALARLLFESESLDALVMYSRFVLLVTFPFMLQNARIPLLLRKSDAASGQSIRKIIYANRPLMLSWAFLSAILITSYAWAIEREYTFGVAVIMLTACVLVFYGNIGATLVFYRRYFSLFFCYASTTLLFATLSVFGQRCLNLTTFNSIAIASFFAQMAFGILTAVSLKNYLKKSPAETI